MSMHAVSRVRGLISVALTAALLGACTGSAPAKPDGGSGGKGGTAGGTAGNGGAGGSPDGGVNADAASGTAGTGGSSVAGASGGGGMGATAGSGGDAGGVAGTAGSTGMDGGAAGSDGAAGSGGSAGTGGATGTGGAGGAIANCTKALLGRYLLRNDGNLLYEADPPSTAQTPVLDGTTGLPLVTDLTGVQEGNFHGCAVQGTSKTAWCWRTGTYGNAYGQLGNGTTDALTTSFLATQVLTAANTPLTNVVAIAAGEVPTSSGFARDSACAVTGDGKLYCWGDLSDLVNGGTALTSAFAVPITTDGATPLAGVLGVSLDSTREGSYACAIVQGASSKEVWCWGSNTFGNLGLGDEMLRRYPTKVLGIANPLKILFRGEYSSTCALDGSNVRCWGYNGDGATGTGTINTPVLSPTIATLMGGATALGDIADLHGGSTASAGVYSNFCALSTTNTIFCWGSGYQSYPTDFGVTNVAALGGTGGYIRYLTNDGLYHFGIASNHVGTTRVPNCGPLH
jgi:hypothetical protein